MGELSKRGIGYSFFWSGRALEERCEAGVRFAVRATLVGKLAEPRKGKVQDRLMTMRLDVENTEIYVVRCQSLNLHL